MRQPSTRIGPELRGRVLAAAIAAIVLMLLGWSVTETVLDRRQTQAQAQAALRTAQALLNEHARISMEDVLDALDEVALRVLRDGPPVPGAAGDWHPWLAGQLPRLPGVAMLSYIDAKGRVAATSWAPDTGADAADHDYFQAHRNSARLHVSRPGATPPGDTPLFRLSLRIEEAGRFVGVAVAAFQTDYFAKFYRALRLPEVPLTTAMLGANGLLIVQEPRARGQDLPSPDRPFGPDPAEGERTIVLNGVPHLASIGRVPGVPLLIAASAAEADILAPWRTRALLGGTLAVAGVAIILVMGLLIGRGLTRERAVLVALQDTNADLEAASHAHQEARWQAESANAAKSRLLAAIGHDLAQPLRALQFHLEAFDDAIVPPEGRVQLDKMRAAAAAQQDMLDQLVTTSALERGALPVRRRRFPLAPLLREAADLCRDAAARTGVDLRVVGCSLHLCSDPALLRRLLMNLIGNAALYTMGGRVLVGCRRGDEALRIEVWDTGPGLGPDDVETIFEEFSRGAAAADTPGLGLGLSIVRRLAGALDVAVTVHSTPGHGSCFAVAIPWDQVEENNTSTESNFQQSDAECPTVMEPSEQAKNKYFTSDILSLT